MKKLTATYHAPKGDSKVVEMLGHSFFDGKSEEVELEDYQADILTQNKYFECSKPVDVDPAKQQAARQAAEAPRQEQPHDAHGKEKEHRGR